jgi:hypothetical protein
MIQNKTEFQRLLTVKLAINRMSREVIWDKFVIYRICDLKNIRGDNFSKMYDL